MKRKTLWILLTLALCIAALWVLLATRLPGWVDERARQWLATRGVEDYELAGFRPGFTGILADRLVLRGRQEGWRFRLRLEDLQVDYHWRTLLDGRIETISVERLVVELEPVAKPGEPGAPVEPGRMLADLSSLHLPLDTVRVHQLQADIPYGGETWRVSGRALKLDNQRRALTGRLSVRGTDPALPILKLTLAPEPSTPWLPGLDVQVGEDAAPLARIAARVEPGRRPALIVDGRFWPAPLGEHWPGLITPGEVRGLEGEVGLQGRIRLPAVIEPDAPGVLEGTEVALEVRAELAAEALAGGVLKTLNAAGSLRLSGSAAALDIDIPDPLRVTADPGASIPWSAVNTGASVAISAPEPLSLNLVDGPVIRAPSLQVELSAGGVDGELSVTDLDWRTGEQLSLTTDLDLRLPVTESGLPLSVAGSLTGNAQRWRGEGEYQVPQWRATGSWRGNFDGNGQGRVGGELELEKLPALLETLRGLLPVPGQLSLKAGKLAADFQLAFSSEGVQSRTGRIEVTGVDGLHGGLAFTGARLSGAVVGDRVWRTTEPLRLRVERLETGVSLTDLEGRAELLDSASLTAARWRLERFRAGLFAGSVELAEPVTLSVPPDGATLPVRVTGVNLAEVLALYEKQGISGSGTLGGKIPVTLGPEGVSIDDGSLAAAGGHIAYRPGNGAAALAGNQHLGMALRLLEDFSYERLEAGVDFTTGGDMTLAVHLSGRNPAVFDGRTVNFNINVEENLFDLFKVLRLTDDLTIELQKRLQR